MATDQDVLTELLEIVRVGHVAWINRDCGPYELTDEQSSIMGAFGGATVGAALATPGQRRSVAQFESGSGDVELITGVCRGTSLGS